MLTENDVIDAVVRHLEEGGWWITERNHTHQRGHDILARKGETVLAVEAKGGTSSKPDSPCYGRPFTNNQKRSHVSVALYKAACVFSARQYRPGIALPSDDRHHRLIEDIRQALGALNVAVFMVDEDRTVREHSISN